VPTHSASFLSFYLPHSELSNISRFLDNFKHNHPSFSAEVISNNLESAYIEIFSKSLAKDSTQRLIYNDLNNTSFNYGLTSIESEAPHLV
jgi:hypothetical protein